MTGLNSAARFLKKRPTGSTKATKGCRDLIEFVSFQLINFVTKAIKGWWRFPQLLYFWTRSTFVKMAKKYIQRWLKACPIFPRVHKEWFGLELCCQLVKCPRTIRATRITAPRHLAWQKSDRHTGEVSLDWQHFDSLFGQRNSWPTNATLIDKKVSIDQWDNWMTDIKLAC